MSDKSVAAFKSQPAHVQFSQVLSVAAILLTEYGHFRPEVEKEVLEWFDNAEALLDTMGVPEA